MQQKTFSVKIDNPYRLDLELNGIIKQGYVIDNVVDLGRQTDGRYLFVVIAHNTLRINF